MNLIKELKELLKDDNYLFLINDKQVYVFKVLTKNPLTVSTDAFKYFHKKTNKGIALMKREVLNAYQIFNNTIKQQFTREDANNIIIINSPNLDNIIKQYEDDTLHFAQWIHS